jgi:hypothetical protein
MSVQSHGAEFSRPRARKHDKRQFRVIATVSFVYFLITGIVTRLLPRTADEQSLIKSRRKPLIREAWESAETTTRMAFMAI